MAKTQNKIIHETESVSIDGTTGEIFSSTETKTIQIPSEPPFIKLYLEDILYFKDIPKSVNQLLFQLLKLMSYGNIITLNSYVKKEIAKMLNIKLNTIDQSIHKLVKNGLFIRKGTGTYLANPSYFGKGSWAEISKIRSIYLNIKYDDKTRNITATVDNDAIEQNYFISGYSGVPKDEINNNFKGFSGVSSNVG